MMADEIRKQTITSDFKKITLDRVNKSEPIAIKPKIGFVTAVTLVVGITIGSGIFVSPQGALANSGSVGLSLIIWATCGVLSMIFGLVYAELGVILPKSGGDYTIIRKGIGDAPAFLIAWVRCGVDSASGRALLALVFADYICMPIFGSCKAPDSIRRSIAVGKIFLISICNSVSINFFTSIHGLFTAMKVITLIVITIGGIVFVLKEEKHNFNNFFEGSTVDITSIGIAIYSCMWAYNGYSYLNEIAEELINPKQNILKALLTSIVLITGFNLCANISYFIVLSKSEILSTSAVAFSWAEHVLGSAAILIPISVMFSVFGASIGILFADARIPFAAARCGHMPEVMSFLHYKTRLPLASVVFNKVLSIILLFISDIDELINVIGLFTFLAQGLAVTSLLRLRYQRRNLPRNKDAFQLPIVVPLIALVVCIFLLIVPFVSNPRIEFVYALAYILSGLFLYVPFVRFKIHLPGVDKITILTQLLMQICPTVIEED